MQSENGKPETTDEFAMAFKQDRWRVDIGGVPVSVYGEPAYHYLQAVNHKMAKMKLALHRIKGGHSADPKLEAAKALQDAE